MDNQRKIIGALKKKRTIDIITTGAKTGLPRRIEIWFTKLNGRIIICGTPKTKGLEGQYTPRDWLVNPRGHSDFTFYLNESIKIDLPATAVEIVDPEDHRFLMSAPETNWYHDQVDSIDKLLYYSPFVEVFINRLTDWSKH